MKANYDPVQLLARSLLWEAEAEAATLPSMREFCLSEAFRFAQMVRRSFETPVVMETSTAIQADGPHRSSWR